jgi:hypothetical protein
MINWCIRNPLEGEDLAVDDPKMIALQAYIHRERKGVPLAPGKHRWIIAPYRSACWSGPWPRMVRADPKRSRPRLTATRWTSQSDPGADRTLLESHCFTVTGS